MTGYVALGEPRIRALRWCLALCVCVMGLTAAWRSLNYEDSLFSYLFMDCRWPEADALLVTRSAAWLMVAASLAALWRRAWPALVLVPCWLTVLSVCDMGQFPPHRWLIPGERAVRIIGPLALAMLVAFPTDGRVAGYRERWAVQALRLAAALTFGFHGVAALLHTGAFLDYIFVAADSLLGVQLEQATVEWILNAIGVADLIVAVALFSGSTRVQLLAAGYMAAWGFITAASRTVHSGLDGLPDTLVRAPNGGVPLALLLYWACSLRRPPATPR